MSPQFTPHPLRDAAQAFTAAAKFWSRQGLSELAGALSREAATTAAEYLATLPQKEAAR